MSEDPIKQYLGKLSNVMDQYQDEIQTNMIPRYTIHMTLTPDQITKVMQVLHPEPYEIGRLTKDDHKS